MARFSKEFVDNVVADEDIVSLVGHYLSLKKAGKEFTALCPFHEEKSPSFTVSPVKQFYHCFGCGAHGNALSFMMEYAGLTFLEAVEKLAANQGKQLPSDEFALDQDDVRYRQEQNILAALEKAKTLYRSNLRIHRAAVEYLKKRGLTGETAAQFGVGYAHVDDVKTAMTDTPTSTLTDAGLISVDEETGELFERLRQRVVFPIHNDKGRIVGFGGRVLDNRTPKYINSPDTPVFQKGDELFGLYFAKQEIRKRNSAVIIEGYMDVLMLHQYGDKRCVAALGTSMTEKQLSKLYKICDEITFCFDGDRAGRAAADRAARIALTVIRDGKSAKFMTLDPEHDPDSYVRTYGIDAWNQLLTSDSIPLSQKLLRMASDGLDSSLPESKVNIIQSAVELLKTIKYAPAYQQALSAMFEESVGQKLTEFPALTSTLDRAGDAMPRNFGMHPNPDRMHFYINFAVLCGLDGTAIESVSDELIDDFAGMISGWFAVAPIELEERFSRNESNPMPELAKVIQSALHGIKQRYQLLPTSALAAEANAVLTVIDRDAKRHADQQNALKLFE